MSDDTRPHLQCEEGDHPSPADLLWARRCWELVDELTRPQLCAA